MTKKYTVIELINLVLLMKSIAEEIVFNPNPPDAPLPV